MLTDEDESIDHALDELAEFTHAYPVSRLEMAQQALARTERELRAARPVPRWRLRTLRTETRTLRNDLRTANAEMRSEHSRLRYPVPADETPVHRRRRKALLKASRIEIRARRQIIREASSTLTTIRDRLRDPDAGR